MVSFIEAFPKLYHFTNWTGVTGILKSNSLWATHCRFLNDKSEYQFATYFLESKIESAVMKFVDQQFVGNSNAANYIQTNGGKEFQTKKLVTDIVNSLYKMHGDDFYVSSFCGFSESSYESQHGLLSQWRGYGGILGFCIVLDTSRASQLLKSEEASFVPTFATYIADVVYSNEIERLETEFSQQIADLADYVRDFLNATVYRAQTPTSFKAQIAFQQIATRYKHRGFSEEQEVRIVCSPMTKKEELNAPHVVAKTNGEKAKPILYRESKSLSVPYIELFGQGFGPLPIERIIVGPGRQAQEAKDLLERMIGERKIDVTLSDIPYV